MNGLATNHALAERIAQRDRSLFGRVRPLDERLAAISRVTAADVQRVARSYLVDENRSIVHVVKPPPSREEVVRRPRPLAAAVAVCRLRRARRSGSSPRRR